ncbi:FecR family protein [Leptospira ryugenii]|uniref:FecR family protein n=1 Tax=Leptospira ryugenii TaxID=1917863 RepID=UPI00143564F0|nr:FecR family protein [Leptospira ryugenii]
MNLLGSLALFVSTSFLPLLFAEESNKQGEGGITIVVEKGQTLSVISKTYLDDPRKWKELLKSNQIDNPNLILPGRKLWIPASLGKKPKAEVSYSQGNSSVFLHSQKESQWKGASSGIGLFIRDEAKTETESILGLRLNNGSELELSPNSHLMVDKLKGNESEEAFFLRKGRLKAIVSKSNGSTNKKMLILNTPAATADVKGTEFITLVDEKDSTILSCYEGLVTVSAQNVSVSVPAGFATFVEKGKAPTKPFLIPEAPVVQP